MCGFVSCISLDGRPPMTSVGAMLPTLVPRGPDDLGTWEHGNVAFGFRRLAIIDLSPGGHQPMVSPDGRYCIVFNGEIYNYLELRRELQGRGHSFRTASDTEVLLRAYEEWGAQCQDRLVGMWAFLIHDRLRGEIFGSRDRFGIKPLFFSSDGGRVLFASEIKAILATLPARPAVNWATAARFLLHGALDETNETFFEGITSIPAANCFTVDLKTGTMAQSRYWNAPPRGDDVLNASEAFGELFTDTMRLHARSDVPLAVHLSGGLDSTSILCGLADLQEAAGSTEPLQAICFTDEEYDETEQIQATIARTGARLHRLTMSAEDIWARLPAMLRAHDEPAHTMTALVSFCLMEVTRRLGVKVVLNGQGADETLAGYSSYFRSYWRELLLRGHWRAMRGQVAAYAAEYGGRPAALIAREIKACVQSQLGELSMYRAAAEIRRRARRDPWFDTELARAHGTQPRQPLAMNLHDDLMSSITGSPLPLYLRVEDRNAMAHSIESRVPFLDHRLVEMALRLPSPELLDGHWNKYLLRRAMVGRIPETVRTRWRKFGFPTPARRWLRGSLAGEVRELLSQLLPHSADVIDAQVVLREFDGFVGGGPDCEQKLFRVIQFLMWRHAFSG